MLRQRFAAGQELDDVRCERRASDGKGGSNRWSVVIDGVVTRHCM